VIEVDRAMLRAAAADCGWPRVEFNDQLAIVGETSWSAAVEHSVPRERRTLLGRLAPCLMRLDAGSARLAGWEATHPLGTLPHAQTPAALRRRLRYTVAVFGDAALLDVIVAGLLLLPVPVQDMVIREIAILAVGIRCEAWTAAADLVGPDGARRPTVIVLPAFERDDAAAIQGRLLHEISHVWRSAPAVPGVDVTPLAVGREALLAVAAEEQWPALAQLPENERRAEALALGWLCAAETSGPPGAPGPGNG
jgi:hypothetical protein